MSIVCYQCKVVNEDDDTNFCSSCGTNLKDDVRSTGTKIDRYQLLSNYLSSKTMQGWTVIERDERNYSAIIVLPGKKISHILHFFITLFTCVWGIVWIILAVKKQKEQRIHVSVDKNGQLIGKGSYGQTINL